MVAAPGDWEASNNEAATNRRLAKSNHVSTFLSVIRARLLSTHPPLYSIGDHE